MPDASPFLIKDAIGAFLCPVCGFAGGFDEHSFVTGADGLDHGVIGTGICPCCLFEPGFDDDPMASEDAQATLIETLLDYRANWIAEGMAFRGGAAPDGDQWNPQHQLAPLYVLAPQLLPMPRISGFDDQGEPGLHRRHDGAIELRFQFMPPESAEDGERSPELFTAFEQVLSEELGVAVMRDDREQFLIVEPKADTAQTLATYLSAFWRDHAPRIRANLLNGPLASNAPFRAMDDYRAALRAAIEPLLKPLGFKCSVTPNLVFRKKTSFGFWLIEFQIGLARNLDAMEPAVFYGVQHANVERLFSLCFDRSRKETKVAPTMTFRWVTVAGKDHVTCADDVRDWVNRLAPLIDSEILPGLERWSDLAAIERVFNSQATVPPDYCQWYGVATYPAAKGILAAGLLDRDDVEASIAFHLAHLGDADHYGYLAQTVLMVRAENAAQLNTRAAIAGVINKASEA